MEHDAKQNDECCVPALESIDSQRALLHVCRWTHGEEGEEVSIPGHAAGRDAPDEQEDVDLQTDGEQCVGVEHDIVELGHCEVVERQ